MGLGGDHVATPLGTETKSVIGAGDSLAVVPAHTERRAAMGTEIVGNDYLAVDSVDDEQGVQQFCGYGTIDYFPRQCNRIPVTGELHPVIGVKRAIERKIERGGYGLNYGYRCHVPL